MKVTPQQLKAILPRGRDALIDTFLPHLNAAMAEFKIDTVREKAHFLFQLSHETQGLTRMSENLNYGSPKRLMAVWPLRFKTETSALPYVMNPEKLANFVYAGRMGNGTPESGDGWRYRGAGGFQLTGKTNQLMCAAHFGIQPSKIGDWLRSPEGACRSAAWFFAKSGAAVQADLNNIDKVSDIINIGRMTVKIGDSIGYADRTVGTHLALKALGA
jgi:putative chitinase